MLEGLKRNDVCIFANGQRVAVRDVNNEGWRVQVLFWSIVKLSDEYVGAMMDYSMDGVPLNISYPNPIVKVVRC